jgi:hypothetical protein
MKKTVTCFYANRKYGMATMEGCENFPTTKVSGVIRILILGDFSDYPVKIFLS